MSRLLYSLAIALGGLVLIALGHPGLALVVAVLVIGTELIGRSRRRQREARTVALINQPDRV